MKINAGLGALLRIIGALPVGVSMINGYLADRKITGVEIVNFAVWAIETIAGKTLDELGIEVVI